MTNPTYVTLVEGARHNPNEPRHFMRVVPTPARQQATLADPAANVPRAAWSYVNANASRARDCYRAERIQILGVAKSSRRLSGLVVGSTL
jgi:hypothetical protein